VILYHDVETFCETPIRDGTHIYAESVEIIIHSWAIDDAPVRVWDATDGSAMPDELFEALLSADTIVGHNYGNFDRTVLRWGADIVIAPERIHDTMIQAMSHGLPGGLDKLCSIFQVPTDIAKDKAGKQLIQLFCKPRPKNQKLRRATRLSHPVEWQRFLDYAGSDISAMRALYDPKSPHAMPRWNYPNNKVGEFDLWVLDQKINDRGFKVDLDLAHGAIAAVKSEKVEKDAETQEATDGRLRSTNQRDALLAELLLEYGVSLPDLTAYTLERRLEDPDLPEPARDLLATRLMMSASSTSKYNRIVKAVSSDGRLRGSLQFCGAARTKRKSGKVFQPQNLPRPDMEQADIEFAIEAMKQGCADMLLDDVMRAAWNALRGLIIADEGRKLVQADLSGIEARVLPWLAGEQWKLDAWRAYDEGRGPKVYKTTAARLLNKSIDDLTSFEVQAWGKVPELAFGYGGAAGAFAAMSKIYGINLPDHEVHEAVRVWRAAHPAIADWGSGFWKQLDDAARAAIRTPGRTFEAGKFIRFERWRNWLRMELPSGGFLSYAAPQIIEDPRRRGSDTVSYMGLNNYTRKFERLTTYGGKLSADATQATAREVLYSNVAAVEEAGYPIILEVHDELLTEPLDTPNHTVQGLISLLTRRPAWIDDNLPLAADGFEGYRYKKEG
jgi:DNA polymerase